MDSLPGALKHESEKFFFEYSCYGFVQDVGLIKTLAAVT